MTAAASPTSRHTLALDHLFSRLAEQAAGRPLPPDADDAAFEAPGAADAAEFAETQPPPPIESAADLKAAHEWLLRERQRLSAYTRSQLARVQNEHQAFVQQAYLKEQGLIFRTQEFNRKEEMLGHQFGVLRQQAAELAERQRKLAPYLDPLWQGEAELAELRRVSGALRQDVNEQRALLERMRSDAASLEKQQAATQAELAARAARSACLLQEKESLAARQAQMSQRLLALDDAEAAARRRAAELDELEARLRREFQQQEEQLAQLRRRGEPVAGDGRATCGSWSRLRAETAGLEKGREAARAEMAAFQEEKQSLAARQTQMSQRLLALDDAEAAARRRAAELDELEARLRREFQQQEQEHAELRRVSASLLQDT